jgi:hypothetical protein
MEQELPMAHIALILKPVVHRPRLALRLGVRLRLMRRNLQRELFCMGMDDRALDDVGISRMARYDWLSALMRR